VPPCKYFYRDIVVYISSRIITIIQDTSSAIALAYFAKGTAMTAIQMRKFKSPWDGITRLIGLLSGPLFISTFMKTDRRLREKLLITVSLANNCST